MDPPPLIWVAAALPPLELKLSQAKAASVPAPQAAGTAPPGPVIVRVSCAVPPGGSDPATAIGVAENEYGAAFAAPTWTPPAATRPPVPSTACTR